MAKPGWGQLDTWSVAWLLLLYWYANDSRGEKGPTGAVPEVTAGLVYMADVVDLTGEPEVIDLTDEPEAKRQDLSKDNLGDDLLDLVYKQLPLREKMRAARVP